MAVSVRRIVVAVSVRMGSSASNTKGVSGQDTLTGQSYGRVILNAQTHLIVNIKKL